MRTGVFKCRENQQKIHGFRHFSGTACSIYGIEQPWKKASSGSNAVGAITSAGTNIGDKLLYW